MRYCGLVNNPAVFDLVSEVYMRYYGLVNNPAVFDLVSEENNSVNKCNSGYCLLVIEDFYLNMITLKVTVSTHFKLPH